MAKKNQSRVEVCYTLSTDKMSISTILDDDEVESHEVSISVAVEDLHQVSELLHTSDRRDGQVTVFLRSPKSEEAE